MDPKTPFRLIKKSIKMIPKRRQRAAVVLMYHRISDEAHEPNWLAVSPSNFEQHLIHIRQAYRPISLLDLAEAVQDGAIPPRSVVVTFDDGYANNCTRALPLLEAAQVPATTFVTAGHVNSSREFWWDELSQLILAAPAVPPTLSLQIQGRNFIYNTATTEQRQDVYVHLTDMMKPLPAAVQNRVLNNLARWSGLKRKVRKDYRVMTTAELKQLSQSKYVDIGAHTMNHPILPTLPPEAQYDEIVNSRRWLQATLDQPVLTFAYPNGDFAHETTKIVEVAGFRTACITVTGRVKPGDDLFRLRRCAVNDWDKETFKHNLEAAFMASG
jgi:peptidoglycan/xylan/chitin deacetylase (PgdA/CDA1 family)